MASLPAFEKARLMRDGSIHSLGLILSSLAGLVLVPLLVRGLGREGYGLWMSSIAAIGLFGAIDLGLRLTIVRELAGEVLPERAHSIRSLFWVHVCIGLVAGFAIAGSGLLAAHKLRLSPASASAAPYVFLFGAISCFFEQLFLYVSAVWAGLRRFHLLNSFSTVASVLRAGCIAGALFAGKGIITVAIVHLGISASSSLCGLLLICRSHPVLRPRIETFGWRKLGEPLRFGALAQAATSIASLQMPLTTLLISVLSGASSVTPFAVGQKFPDLLSGLTWRTSEVFFPLAGRQRRSNSLDPTDFLATITRWLLLVLAPAALGLAKLTPNLLRVWMGTVDPTALAVMRIACASVLLETFIPGAIQLFWGAGETKSVLIVNCVTIVPNVILGVLLLPSFGAAGAAWAILGSTLVAVALLVRFCVLKKGVHLVAVMSTIGWRLPLAVLLSSTPVYLFRNSLGYGWADLLLLIALAVVVYFAALWTFAATSVERDLMASVLGFMRPPSSKARAANP